MSSEPAIPHIDLITEPGPVRAFSTMAGFSICHYTGADPAEVAAGLDRLARLTGISREHIFVPRQVHSAAVAIVTPHSTARGIAATEADALVTATPGLLLCINTADCLPLVMADAEAGVYAAAHCGWRGTVAGVAAHTLQAMTLLGARPGRIRAWMGPCIGPECFEVGPEVAAQFPPEAVMSRPEARPHVHLAGAVGLQLAACGVTHVAGAAVCSMCSPDFYSVRRQGRTLRERTLTCISLQH